MEINDKVIITKNDNYLLTGTIKSIENPAITLINIKLGNDIISLGELISDDTKFEWPECNDQAIAIIGEYRSSEKQYIKTLFYIPNKSFIYDDQNIKFEELFRIKSNDKKQKIKVKK